MIKLSLSSLNDDSMLFSTIQYYTVPFLYTILTYLRNPWIGIWIIYTLIPLLDEILTIDLRNPTKEEAKKLENQMKFKIPVYICVISEWMLLFWMLKYLTTQDLSVFQIAGVLFLCGNVAASNINIAHELFHKDDWLDKTLGTVALARNLYMHFAIEHLFGHHKNVGTPKDPATSCQGESLYSFLPKTIVGSYKSAWKIENNLMKQRYGSEYVIQNRMLWYTASYFIIPLGIYCIYGFMGMVYFMFSVFNSVIYLESINYIEHYGLSRKEVSPGVYERVDIRHSWNAPHRLSNYLLFKLQRHSDHHENPYKPYQILCSYDESPCLPHGYTVCILLCYFPKLWFEIMDNQLESWRTNGKGILIKDYAQNQNKKKILSFILKIGVITTTFATLSLINK